MLQLPLALRSLFIAAALVCTFVTGASAQVSVGLSVNLGPPALPVYVQPPAPAPNELWIPGYWAWGAAGYYWVPGTWAAAPQPGLLWTPGYWAYAGGAYGWHPGYWGAHIGYYGGISYGFGYFGVGYVGGGWYGNTFRYNTAVTNVNTTVIHDVYVNKTVVNNYNTTTINRVSYNGGPGGVQAQPTAEERAVESQQRFPATAEQKAHVRTASQDRNLLASVNRGEPATAASARPMNRANRPESFTPLNSADREGAQEHVVSAPRSAAYGKSTYGNGTYNHGYNQPHGQTQSHTTGYQSVPAGRPQGSPPHGQAKPPAHPASNEEHKG